MTSKYNVYLTSKHDVARVCYNIRRQYIQIFDVVTDERNEYETLYIIVNIVHFLTFLSF